MRRYFGLNFYEYIRVPANTSLNEISECVSGRRLSNIITCESVDICVCGDIFVFIIKGDDQYICIKPLCTMKDFMVEMGRHQIGFNKYGIYKTAEHLYNRTPPGIVIGSSKNTYYLCDVDDWLSGNDHKSFRVTDNFT